MIRCLSQQDEVYLRIAEDGMDFVYTIKRGERVLESAAVAPEPRGEDNRYYGDSRAMD